MRLSLSVSMRPADRSPGPAKGYRIHCARTSAGRERAQANGARSEMEEALAMRAPIPRTGRFICP